MDNNNDCQLNIALMGKSENLITWGTILSRKGLTLSGIYMPNHEAALASVLLFGCPAYTTSLETAQAAELLFIEADFFQAEEESQREQMWQAKRDGAIVFIHFNSSTQMEKFGEEIPDSIGKLSLSQEESDSNSGKKCEVYDLQLCSPLPSIGKYILRVDEVCAGRPHEPNPSEDYSLSCSGMTWALRPRQDRKAQEANIERIIETALS